MSILTDMTGLVSSLEDGSPDSWSGLLASALAGGAAAIAVTILLTLYFSAGYRSPREVARHAFSALVAVGLLAYVAYDMRHAAFDYLGINASKPEVEFEIRLPSAVASTIAAADTQIELHTDRNQTLATVSEGLWSTEDGRRALRGSVPLEFRTADRTVVLSLPGQAQRLFKLRLAPSPTPTDAFGPWHLVDRVVSRSQNDQSRTAPDDAFAIRYRVI
jgi:hypothetical protein